MAYKTYDPKKEGYGNPNQWKQAFANRLGLTTSIEKARSILGVTSLSSTQEIKTCNDPSSRQKQ